MLKELTHEEALDTFIFHSILSTDNIRKELKIILCDPSFTQKDITEIPANKRILVYLKRNNFLEKNWKNNDSFVFNKDYFREDIYKKYLITNKNVDENNSEAEVIFPFPDQTLFKHTKKKNMIINETEELYSNLKKNYIDKIPKENEKWIENIINGNSDEQILHRTNDYVIGIEIL